MKEGKKGEREGGSEGVPTPHVDITRRLERTVTVCVVRTSETKRSYVLHRIV